MNEILLTKLQYTSVQLKMISLRAPCTAPECRKMKHESAVHRALNSELGHHATGRLAGRKKRMVRVRWAGTQRETGQAWPDDWLPWGYLNDNLKEDARSALPRWLLPEEAPAEAAAGVLGRRRRSPRLPGGLDVVAGGAAHGAEGTDAGAEADEVSAALNCGGPPVGRELREAMVLGEEEAMEEEAEATSAMGTAGSAADHGAAEMPQRNSSDTEESLYNADEPARRQRLRAAAELRAELGGEASWRHVLAGPAGVRGRAMGKRPMATKSEQETRRPRVQQERTAAKRRAQGVSHGRLRYTGS